MCAKYLCKTLSPNVLKKILASIFVLGVFSSSIASDQVFARVVSKNADWRTPLVEGEHKLQSKELSAAESAFRQALANVKNDSKSTPEDLALCMQSLAYALYMQDNFEDVLPLQKKALKVMEKAYGKESGKVVGPFILLGALFEDEGEYKNAVKYYQKAVNITLKVDGQNSLTYGDYLHRLGRATFKNGYPIAAENLYYEALQAVMKQSALPSGDLLEQHLSDYIDLLSKSENRGKILSSYFQKELLKDRTSSIERLASSSGSRWNKEVSVRIANGASSSSSSSSSSETVGRALTPVNSTIVPDRPINDFVALESVNKQRVAFYERLIATDIDSLGAEHPSVARDLGGLASIYLAQRKFEEAKPLLSKALAIYEKVYSEDAAPVKRTRAILQLISEETSQPVQAKNLDLTYISNLPPISQSVKKLEIAYRLNDLAFANYCQGKIDRAEKIYSWAVASTASSAGEASMLAVASLIDYSRALRSGRHQQEADFMDDTAQALLRRNIAADASRFNP
ncbi:MAG: tetratricopeptide repeat protein [Leptolyngbya sp.]|nr:tetratricopeptide repeat protein [Candidatus Melainabacteria bacterium]